MIFHLCVITNKHFNALTYTIFARLIMHFFFYFGRWKIGVCKICGFFFLWRAWSGFYSSILVFPRNLSLLNCTTLYNYYSSFPSWNFNTNAHENWLKATEIFMVHSSKILLTTTQRATTPYFQGQASVLKYGI